MRGRMVDAAASDAVLNEKPSERTGPTASRRPRANAQVPDALKREVHGIEAIHDDIQYAR